MFRLSLIACLMAFALPVHAGDAASGEKLFKQCKSCHAVTKDDGTAVVKGGKTGPNLWAMVGRTAGSVEGFKYGDDLTAVGAAGLVWDEASLAAWMTDPGALLSEKLGEGAKSKMTFKLKTGGEDVAAYLASLQ